MNADDRMDMRDMQLELARLRAQLATARDQLESWVEYFGAIERGEVGAPRAQIRTFENILLDGSRQALAAMGASTSSSCRENARTEHEPDAGKDGG